MKLTCKEIWLKNVEFYGNKLAVVDEKRRFTYSELNDRANRLYWALKERGVQRGDRVAIWGYNCVEYLDLRLCCEKFGLWKFR